MGVVNMVEVKNVHGSELQAVPLIIGVDTVYVHTNIHQEEHEDEMSGETVMEWVYDEIQYTHLEYMRIQAAEQQRLQQSLEDAQLALCEMYESMEAN